MSGGEKLICPRCDRIPIASLMSSSGGLTEKSWAPSTWSTYPAGSKSSDECPVTTRRLYDRSQARSGNAPPVTCAISCTTGTVLFSVLLNNNIMLYKTYLQPIKISKIFSGIFALQNCAIGATTVNFRIRQLLHARLTSSGDFSLN
jgi:hypothetical protein